MRQHPVAFAAVATSVMAVIAIPFLSMRVGSADAATDPFTEMQIANYDRMLATLREHGIDAPLHHFANSAATLRGLVRPGDFARVGLAL